MLETFLSGPTSGNLSTGQDHGLQCITEEQEEDEGGDPEEQGVHDKALACRRPDRKMQTITWAKTVGSVQAKWTEEIIKQAVARATESVELLVSLGQKRETQSSLLNNLKLPVPGGRSPSPYLSFSATTPKLSEAAPLCITTSSKCFSPATHYLFSWWVKMVQFSSSSC